MRDRLTDPTPTVLPLPEDLYPNGKPEPSARHVLAHTQTCRIIPHDILWDELKRVLPDRILAAAEQELIARFGYALVELDRVAKIIRKHCWNERPALIEWEDARVLLAACKHPIFDTYVE